jgi:pyrroline-5-carboxylate reductase
MINKKLAFIGAGNMAKAIIGGLIAQGYDAKKITATGPRIENLQKVADEFSVNISTDNIFAASDADVIILAVKPQMLKQVATELSSALTHQPLIISLAAGITTESLQRWLNGNLSIVRSMPNTPSQVLLGATGLFANAIVSDEQKNIANAILSAVGIVSWVEQENLINTVTAVSGSGPAYYFLLMEAMIDAAVEQGLSRETATVLTLQTALGAATLALKSDLDVAELRRRVTSPKGTTEQAIMSFEKDQLRTIVKGAMQACTNRAEELSQLLGE